MLLLLSYRECLIPFHNSRVTHHPLLTNFGETNLLKLSIVQDNQYLINLYESFSLFISAIFVGLMMFLTTLSLIMTVIVLRMYLSEDVPSPPKHLLSVITAIDMVCPGSRVSKVVPLSKDDRCVSSTTLCHGCPNETTGELT